jgi:hypothetical protein
MPLNAKSLKQALQNGVTLAWNDPDPIEDNDYIITSIKQIDNVSVHIQYNQGLSEAAVFIHEIQVHSPLAPLP